MQQVSEMLAARLEAERPVEGRDAVDVDERPAGLLGDDLERVLGEVGVLRLDVLEDGDQLPRSPRCLSTILAISLMIRALRNPAGNTFHGQHALPAPWCGRSWIAGSAMHPASGAWRS